MIVEELIPEYRHLIGDAMRSSLHVAVASIGADGFPHVTPIGSMRMRKDGVGVFFEVFTQQLSKNVERDPRVCVMAVNSSKRFWLKALLQGQFHTLPGVRLRGTVGPRRESTEEERAWWERRVRRIMWMRGAQALFGGGGLRYVREITFTEAVPIVAGTMTEHLLDSTPPIAVVAPEAVKATSE